MRIFGINFAVGVVTGVPMEFQFGTNGAGFSRATGRVIGHTLAMEGLFAFFLESSFLAVLVWGERRVGRVGHFLAAIALFVGSWLSGYFIIATNSFMQHPVGHEVGDPIWRALWDAGLGVSSILLAVFFGAALGNLLRGLPVDDRGWFSLALFTDFSARAPVGILDWYTVLVGVFALLALMLHGALFLAWKTEGPVHDRSVALAGKLVIVLVVGWVLVTLATVKVQPAFFAAFATRPLAWVAISTAIAGIGAIVRSLRTRQLLVAFAGSAVFIGGLLIETAVTLFPVMLMSVGDPARSITAYAAANDDHGLRLALGWWSLGFPLAIAYFVVVFRLHRGQATTPHEGEGY
jgi:cytochrome d ubiquinol oxidase subunit II